MGAEEEEETEREGDGDRSLFKLCSSSLFSVEDLCRYTSEVNPFSESATRSSYAAKPALSSSLLVTSGSP